MVNAATIPVERNGTVPTPSAVPVPKTVQAPGILRSELLSPSRLRQLQDTWSELAKAAIVANPFYEPWMLLPAFEYLDEAGQVQCLGFFESFPDGSERMVGLFPLIVQKRCLNLPVSNLAFWQHRYCFLAVPLVHVAHTWAVLEAFWRWFESNPFGCRLLDTNYLPGDGPFHAIWSDFLIGRHVLPINEYPRALMQTEGTASSYIGALISKKHQDEFRRWERRLSELGSLEYQQPQTAGEAETFIEEFVTLENTGWKGQGDGGAFARREEDVAFLRAVTRSGYAEKRVMLLSLRLDGKAIALKHNLLTGDAGFAFKITFDEQYSKYSPGLLLEIENIRRAFSAESGLQWMDSCASPRHPMVNRIWRERRIIRRAFISNRSRGGDLLVSVLPLLRWASKQLSRDQTPRYFQVSTASAPNLPKGS